MSAKSKITYGIRQYMVPISRIQVDNKENLISKKICKSNVLLTRKPLSNFNNFRMQDNNVFTKINASVSQFVQFESRRTKIIHKFNSYNERFIPKQVELQKKIISHTMDNDCETDDEQVKAAIKSLKKSLDLAIQTEIEDPIQELVINLINDDDKETTM